MIPLLRIIRGLFGILFGMQILHLLPVITWINGGVTGGMVAVAMLKVLLLLLFGALFFGLRALINWLHAQKHGCPHPALVKTWAL
jgi:hypothetical protein